MARLARIAPTPSGYLHIGNAFNFMLSWALAHKLGYSLFLRIDDFDVDRLKDEYVKDLFECLAHLKIEWELGPQSFLEYKDGVAAGVEARQKGQEQLLSKLKELGLLYACSCSRSDIKKINPNGFYPGTCRNKKLPLDSPQTCLRFNLEDAQSRLQEEDYCWNELFGEAANVSAVSEIGDFVAVKKDGKASYQIASLAWDISLGVDLIVRGNDLRPSTAAQCLIAALCGHGKWVRQAKFHHHDLIFDRSKGHKLSKSKGSEAICEIFSSQQLKENFFEKLEQFVQADQGEINDSASFLEWMNSRATKNSWRGSSLDVAF